MSQPLDVGGGPFERRGSGESRPPAEAQSRQAVQAVQVPVTPARRSIFHATYNDKNEGVGSLFYLKAKDKLIVK